MNYPVEFIRSQFPSLKRKYKDKRIAFFDGPSGSQIVNSAIDAMVEYLTYSNANLGGKYATSQESENYIEEARKAMANFLGTKPSEIAFGPNMTTLAFNISRALSRDWKEGDEIVITELDHRANVDPWLVAAEEKNVKINWIPLDTENLVLDLTNIESMINENTKLVAIGHASNGIGTINNIAKISNITHKYNAIMVVDAVHSAPHLIIDRDELDADIIFCSAYKFFGPHLGIVAIREDLFDRINTYKVKPSPNSIPDKLETGTQNHEGIAALTPTIDFIASLGEGNSRRDRIKDAFSKIEDYENNLASKLRSSLKNLPNIILLQADTKKTPTIAFIMKNKTPTEICEYLSENYSVFAGDGHFYAQTIGDLLDINKDGGWVRIGIAPYNTEEEVNRLIQGITDLTVQN